MSQIALYKACAPVFLALLDNLSSWLDKAEVFAKEKNFDVETLLNARLAPDMLPLGGQIGLMTAFAKNAMCRLAGETPPDFPDSDRTLVEMRARIKRARDIVAGIKPEAFKDAATRTINVRTGPDTNENLSGEDFLLLFALPNFYFHAATAYDILRHNGVPIGKRDFLPKRAA
jgi:uncharacterized protein